MFLSALYRVLVFPYVALVRPRSRHYLFCLSPLPSPLYFACHLKAESDLSDAMACPLLAGAGGRLEPLRGIEEELTRK